MLVACDFHIALKSLKVLVKRLLHIHKHSIEMNMLFQSRNFWLTVLKMSIKTGFSDILLYHYSDLLWFPVFIDHCCIMENLMKFKWNSERNNSKLEQYTQKTLILKQQGQSPILLVLVKKDCISVPETCSYFSWRFLCLWIHFSYK